MIRLNVVASILAFSFSSFAAHAEGEPNCFITISGEREFYEKGKDSKASKDWNLYSDALSDCFFQAESFLDSPRSLEIGRLRVRGPQVHSLRQRLVRPSEYKIRYLFPGSVEEAFESLSENLVDLEKDGRKSIALEVYSPKKRSSFRLAGILGSLDDDPRSDITIIEAKVKIDSSIRF